MTTDVEHVDAAVAPVVTAPRRGRASVAVGVVSSAIGVVLVWAFLAPLGGLTGVLKIPGVLAGAALAFHGYGMTGRAIWGRSWDPGFWLSCAWLVALAFGAVFADLLPLAEPVDITQTISEPGNARPDLFSAHPLGTNNFSLDLLARSLYGARVSLATALLATTLGLAVGGVVGVSAGFFRGGFDRVVGVIVDASLAFPALILLVALATVFGRPTTPAGAVLKTGMALAIVGLPVMIRLARSHTLTLTEREFVTASRAMGATRRRIIAAELAPNVAVPLLSFSFVLVAVLIVAEGALAFLGLGLQQPEPTWGNMIAEGGLSTLVDYPHIPLVPGAFMFFTVLSLNRIGERAMSSWGQREARL